ncbi:Protein of unknown function (DUF784) [Melia azedarach]|uniref:Uncharacterized protein n=1 Tax=Melia azedarach TaxID=155640 RepID=A0ACC1XEA6_MELAZ|nr:Protein of unknown function (DUF784) [Melia azedarach]
MILNTSANSQKILEANHSPGAEDNNNSALAPEDSHINEEYDVPASPPRPANNKFRLHCVQRITTPCSEEAFDYLFRDVNVSKTCCHQIVNMGKTCHIVLTEGVFSVPKFKPNATVGIRRGKQFWDKCVAIAGNEASSPTPSEF